MKIIEIKSLNNGSHKNQFINDLHNLPSGWALIPDNMETKNFPFGNVIIDIINNIPTVIKWEPLEIPKIEININNRINQLKNQLLSTDYKVIKCYEALLMNKELPYDIISLHNERQNIRNQINDLEREVN